MYKLFAFVFSCCFFVQLSAQDISSVFLLYPQDEQVVQENYPTFSWTPEASNTAYRIRIVEMLDNQTAESAFQSNPAHFYQENLRVNALTYPMGSLSFEAGKKYAWSVCSITQNEKIAISSKVGDPKRETFEQKMWSNIYWFEFKGDAIKKSCVAKIEASPEQENSSSIFYKLDNQLLLFSFSEKLDLEPNYCQYRFLDQNQQPIKSIQRKIVPNHVGDHYEIALRQYAFFREKETQGKIFFLEVLGNGQNYYIKFINN